MRFDKKSYCQYSCGIYSTLVIVFEVYKRSSANRCSIRTPSIGLQKRVAARRKVHEQLTRMSNSEECLLFFVPLATCGTKILMKTVGNVNFMTIRTILTEISQFLALK